MSLRLGDLRRRHARSYRSKVLDGLVAAGLVLGRIVADAEAQPLEGLHVVERRDAFAETVHIAEVVLRARIALLGGAQIPFRRLPVVDEREVLVGVLSMSDIAREAERLRASKSRKRPIKDGELIETLGAICSAHTNGKASHAA